LGGINPAEISACGGISTIFLDAGEEVVFVCSSITLEVVRGPTLLIVFADNELTGRITLTTGQGFTFIETSGFVIAPETNDVIVKVNDIDHTVLADTSRTLADMIAGQPVSVNISQNGQLPSPEFTVSATYDDPEITSVDFSFRNDRNNFEALWSVNVFNGGDGTVSDGTFSADIPVNNLRTQFSSLLEGDTFHLDIFAVKLGEVRSQGIKTTITGLSIQPPPAPVVQSPSSNTEVPLPFIVQATIPAEPLDNYSVRTTFTNTDTGEVNFSLLLISDVGPFTVVVTKSDVFTVLNPEGNTPINIQVEVTDKASGYKTSTTVAGVIINQNLQSADLELTKTTATTEILPGGSFDYTVTVTNHGPDDAENVLVSDLLITSSMDLINVVSSAGPCTFDSIGFDRCNLGTMTKDATHTITLTVRIDAGLPVGTTFVNSAIVESSTPDPIPNNSKTIEGPTVVTLPTTTDVTITQTANKAQVQVGDTFDYIITVKNIGLIPAEQVSISEDVFPHTFEPSTSSPECQFLVGPSTANCFLGFLAAGEEKQIVLTVKIVDTNGGTLVNTVQVFSPTDENKSNNSFTTEGPFEIRIPKADLDVDASNALVLQIPPGGKFVYTVVVLNRGFDEATNVILEVDAETVGVEHVESVSDSRCSVNTSNEKEISCNFGTMSLGLLISIDINMVSDLQFGNFLEIHEYSVTVSSSTADPDPDNNVDSATGPPVKFPNDIDFDGITNVIDPDTHIFSFRFTDKIIDGSTEGTILDRGDSTLSISELENPLGVRIESQSNGPNPAQLDICNGQYAPQLSDATIDVTCPHSVDVQVQSGIVDGIFTDINGDTVDVSLNEGDSFFFDDETFTMQSTAGTAQVTVTAEDGTAAEVSLTEGNAITVDPETSIITADPDNPTDVTITIDGEETTVTPGGSAVSSPEQAIQSVIDELTSIVSENPGTSLADKVEDASASVQTVLDELNKTPPDNQAAAGIIEGAIGSLEDAIKDNILDQTQGEQFIDQLLTVSRQLATNAISIAINTPGSDAGKISSANAALANGDSLRTTSSFGDFKNAAAEYKTAISEAEGAIP